MQTGTNSKEDKISSIEKRLFNLIDELHEMQQEGMQSTKEYRDLAGLVSNLQYQYVHFCVALCIFISLLKVFAPG